MKEASHSRFNKMNKNLQSYKTGKAREKKANVIVVVCHHVSPLPFSLV
jgi:hypothetical protein